MGLIYIPKDPESIQISPDEFRGVNSFADELNGSMPYLSEIIPFDKTYPYVLFSSPFHNRNKFEEFIRDSDLMDLRERSNLLMRFCGSKADIRRNLVGIMATLPIQKARDDLLASISKERYGAAIAGNYLDDSTLVGYHFNFE